MDWGPKQSEPEGEKRSNAVDDKVSQAHGIKLAGAKNMKSLEYKIKLHFSISLLLG